MQSPNIPAVRPWPIAVLRGRLPIARAGKCRAGLARGRRFALSRPAENAGR